LECETLRNMHLYETKGREEANSRRWERKETIRLSNKLVNKLKGLSEEQPTRKNIAYGQEFISHPLEHGSVICTITDQGNFIMVFSKIQLGDHPLRCCASYKEIKRTSRKDPGCSHR
jgi:hypothetical protein